MVPLGASHAPLVCLGARGFVSRIDGWAAGQEGVSPGGAAVVEKRTDLGVGVDQIAINRVGGVILNEVMPSGQYMPPPCQ